MGVGLSASAPPTHATRCHRRPTAASALSPSPGLSHMGFAELSEEAGEEGVVPCGAHALSFHGLLGAFELGKVESKAPQQGDVLRSVIFGGSGLFLVHGYVENPM